MKCYRCTRNGKVMGFDPITKTYKCPKCGFMIKKTKQKAFFEIYKAVK